MGNAKSAVKVTVCFNSFSNAGTERVMISAANGLADLGLDVSIAVMVDEGELRDAVSPKIKIIGLGASSTRYRSSLGPLVRYLRHDEPDVMICALYNEPALIARMLTRSRTKIITTVHLSPLGFLRGGARQGSMRLGMLLSKLFGNRADAVVTVSEALKDEVAASGIDRDKITTIYNPVIRDDMPRKLAEPIDHPWFTDKTKPIFFTAGRLEIQKDHATLIRAFDIVRKEVDSRLVIAGGGSLRDELQGLIDELGLSDCAQLLGAVPNVLPYMAGSDLFVLSSVTEGLPTVLIEDMYCRTPIVSTDCPTGPSEILDGGRYGRMVGMGDALALAAAMIDELRSPSASSDELRARAMDFTVEIAAKKYAALIDRVLGPSRAVG